MRINPRQHLLEVWMAYASVVRPDGRDFIWGGRAAPNSISDAEQVLVLLYPATEILGLSLDCPDSAEDDVVHALGKLGNAVSIPRLVLDLLAEFLQRNTDKDGQPVFGAASYVVPDTDSPMVSEQFDFAYVESYSISLTLCLAAAGFTKAFSAAVTRPELRERIAAVEAAITKRLTAAMVGLLRSFTLNALGPGTKERDRLLFMIGQGRTPSPETMNRLHRELESVRAQLPELTIGVAQDIERFDDPEQLFEVGWTWGIADDAPKVEDIDPRYGLEQPDGYAVSRPSLYFTSVALDGLADLFSDRTLRLGLITGDQQRLVRALELRWNLTQQYWSTVARFGDDRWPLEDVPWLTTDGQESIYNTLLIFSILRRDRISRRISDDELTRAVAVLEELAIRGRITRRLTQNDDSLRLHTPGVQIPLAGSDALGGPQLSWYVTDFAINLGKRAVEAAAVSGQPPARERLFAIAEAAMENIWNRRITMGPNIGLWDDLSGAYPGVAPQELLPSWTVTERVMEFLVATSAAYGRNPLRTQRLYDDALGLLAEADHKLGRELQLASGEGGALNERLTQVQEDILHARRLAPTEPGTACAILYAVLRQLEALPTARKDVTWSR